jgi:hypothetical protein
MPGVYAEPLNISGDEYALTVTLLDQVQSEEFELQTPLITSGLIKHKPLAKNQLTHTFPFAGDSPEEGAYHVPGAELTGGTLVQGSTTVSLDDIRYKVVDLPIEFLDRSVFPDVARALRKCIIKETQLAERRAMRLLVNAARTSGVTDVHAGGQVVERVANTIADAYPVSDTGASNFCADLAEMGQEWDERDIPPDNRIVIITPYLRRVLTRSNRFTNFDYDKSVNIMTRSIGMLEGFQVQFTNWMPSTTITAGTPSSTTDLTKYTGDYAVDGATGAPAALCLYTGGPANDGNPAHGAISMVETIRMQNTWYDQDRLTWRTGFFWRYGMGTVDVFTAGEIRVDAA